MAGDGVVGILENLETGEREELERIHEVTWEEASFEVEDRHVPRLRRLWQLGCGERDRCPGKVWRLFLAIYRKDPSCVMTAWSHAWLTDAQMLVENVKYCGTKTLEVVTGQGTTYQRDRCKSTRCEHCGSRIVGYEWNQRIVAQGIYDQANGKEWGWGTLTMDPAKWCEENGVPLCQASAILAQRWIGEAFGRLVEVLRCDFPDLDVFRVIELHKSAWPHVHFLFRGSMQWVCEEEARQRGCGNTWAEVAAYSVDQKRRQFEGELRVARCPFPDMRKRLKGIALECGFGMNVDLSPVLPGDIGRLAVYLTKGPQSHAKRIPDPILMVSMAGELTKAKQRAARPLARGVRAFEASRKGGGRPGFLHMAPRPVRERNEDLVAVRRVNLPIETVRATLIAVEASVSGDVIVPDFGGPPPDPGGKRPRVIEGFVADASFIDGLKEYVAHLAAVAEAKARARGYEPIIMRPAGD